MLWYVPGQGYVDDADPSIQIPHYGELALPDGSKLTWGEQGITQVPTYTLSNQFGGPVQWDPGMGGATPAGVTETAPGYINRLLQWADLADAGQLQPFEQTQWETLKREALSVPTRDVQGLRFEWEPAGGDWQGVLGVGSPDLGAQLLGMRERLIAGTATPHERALHDQLKQVGGDWDYRASVPQASDVGIGFGDNLFGALAILGTGLGAGAALGPIAAGTASTLGTLGGLGTTAGLAGGWANTIGGATGQGWMQDLGKALGIAGGLAGGVAGLGSTLSQGVTTLTQAAQLAQQSGKVLGSLGQIPGAGPLQQPARYLGMAGQLGQAGGGVQNLFGASGAAQAAATGGRMAWDDWGKTDWLDWSGGGQGALLSDAAPAIDWSSFTAGGPGSWAGQMTTDGLNGGGGGGGGLLSTLGSLAGGVGKLLGSNSNWLGPAVSGLAGLGTGLLGSNASNDAAALQAAALNRAIDLQQANWLMQQARTAPWVEAGQQALGQLQGLVGQQQPTLGTLAPIRGADYGLPHAWPGWTPTAYQGPQAVNASDYRYTPGQGPQAAQYRYTPGAIPDADQFAYRPGAVPTLSGAQLLANDPGYQFRMDEARRALEASAAARGGLTSGATLSALQRQAQDLASQEYGQGWNRASQQAQMREQWAQQASQMGFGQQMSEAQLREQVNQIASQQGWSQAQAEAAFREQLAQQARTQNWQQALQGQQTAWNQGLQAQQYMQQQLAGYNQTLYDRVLQESKLRYGQDWQAREAEYQRLVDQYNAQRQGQNTAWNQLSTLAGYGPTAISQLGTQGQAAMSTLGNLYGQLGSSQALGQMGPALSWQNALTGGAGAFQNLLKGLNA